MLNWNDVLQQYKIKLSNLSRRNRNIKAGKLSQGKLTDFFPFGFVGRQGPMDILDKLAAGKKVALIPKLDPRYPNVGTLDKELTLLYREANKIYEETGSNELYLAAGFIFGKFIDGTEVNAPLLLLPVRLVRNRIRTPRWELIPQESESLYNYFFLLAYQKFNKHPVFKEALDEAPKAPFPTFRDALTKYYEHLEKLNVELKIPSQYLMGLFRPYTFPTQEDYEKIAPGQLEVKPFLVLGIFPQTRKGLSEDYDDLMEMLEENPKLIENWIKNLNITKQTNSKTVYYPFLFDESQRKILEHIQADGSAIVHGPPGTGKSQLLLNIIINAIAQNQKVLVISQKKAALNVLYQRMKQLGLQELAFLVHDYKSDKQNFYKKLKTSIEKLLQTQDENEPQSIAPLISLEKQLHKKLQNPFEKLQQKLPCGLSPHQIYVRLNFSENNLFLSVAKKFASKFSYEELQSLKWKFQEILLYKHLFDKEHPWISRYPLLNKTEQDKIQTARFLERKLPETLQRLKQLRQEYPEITRKNLLKELTEHIAFLEKILAVPYLKELFDQDTQKQKSYLEFLTKKFREIKKIKYVNPEFPREWKPIAETLTTLETLEDSLFKIFKPVYHKSRGFLKKNAKNLGAPPTELEKEVKTLMEFEMLLQEYARKPLYKEIPTEFPLGNFEKILENKRETLLIIEEFYQKFNTSNIKEIKNLLEDFKYKQTLKQEYDTLLSELKNLFTDAQIQKIFEALQREISEKEISQKYLNAWLNDFSDMRELDVLVSELYEKTRSLLYFSLDLLLKKTDWFEELLQAFLFVWITEAEKKFPELRFSSSKSYEQTAEEYLKIREEKTNKLAPVLLSLWKQRIKDVLRFSEETPDFLYQIRKQRKLWSLRKLFSTFPELISASVPCMLSSPETAASILPMHIADFDLVLLDEASQCPVEEAFPVLLRGKKLLITGDEKQLPPLNLFKVSAENLLDEEDYRLEHIIESESSLDFALKYLPEFYLEWHYRSLFRELIEFSNYAFYEGKLKTLPLRVPDKRFMPPLQYIKLENGIWEDNKNVAEALKIIELTKKFLAWKNPPTLGIITFNRQQQDLILDFLDKYLDGLSPQEIERIAPLIYGTENRPPLFVKNIENVQGDERDVILFSVGYAKDKQGKLRHHFGLLNLEGGERRLNVAVSRAKKKICLVTSISPEELKTEGIKNAGPRLLKKYLHYVKKISDGIPLNEKLLASLFPQIQISSSEFNEEPHLFYRKVKKELSGYSENLGSKEFHLDFADFNTGKAYILEGKQFFNLKQPTTRHYHIIKYLEKLGWNLQYLYSRNYAFERKEV